FFGGLAGLCVVFVFGAVVHLRRQGIRLTFAAPVEVPSVAAAIAAASTMSTLSPSSSAVATDVSAALEDDDDGRRPALHFDTTGNYTTTFVTRSAMFNMVQCAAACQLLADEQYKLAVLGRDQLNLMASDEGNMSVLDNLRMIKNATSDLESQVNGVRRMLIDMLDDDEELHMLHLTKNNYGTGAAVELMLHTIQNTEAIVMLKLDAKRNYLIIVDLLMTLVTTLVAVSNFFVNAFTMNVVSWLKDLDWVYWTWIAVAAAFP
ncbi:hypothetical protein DYB31_016172, partial [Aphanomyces astaci]